MKKILFETIGNILMMALFAAAAIELFIVQAEYSANGQFFTFGLFSIGFIIYLILFGLAKWLFSKRNEDYSSQAGEFSAADEREHENARFAAVTAYKAIITSLMFALVVFIFIAVLAQPPFQIGLDLFVSGILLLTSVICIGFMSYGAAWIYQDTR